MAEKRGRVDGSLKFYLKLKIIKITLSDQTSGGLKEIISRSLIYKKKYELAYKIAVIMH